jgi:hypothetical protein
LGTGLLGKIAAGLGRGGISVVFESQACVMRAADGSIGEVFEWRSAEAIQQANSNPAIQALWAEFGAACDYTPLTKLAETHQTFAEFDAFQL